MICYLITAGHVLKVLKQYPDGVGVPLGQNGAKAWTFGDGLHVMPVNDEKFDFGVFSHRLSRVGRTYKATLADYRTR
jgi:hypothetical protein